MTRILKIVFFLCLGGLSADARYLQPEPLVQSPYYVKNATEVGLTVATYSYANNNPLRYVDANGLSPGQWFPTPEAAARDAFQWIDLNMFAQSSTVEMGANITPLASGVAPAEPLRAGFTYDVPQSLGSVLGGYLSPSPNACADIHNHLGGSWPSERDLRGFLNRAKANGLPYTGFVSNNAGSYWSAAVTRVPLAPTALVPSISLPNYFSTGGGSWW